MKKIFIAIFILLSVTCFGKATYLEGINTPKIIQLFQENGYTYKETTDGTHISFEKESHNFRRSVSISRRESRLRYAIHITSSHSYSEPNYRKVKANLIDMTNLLCQGISNEEITSALKELAQNIKEEDVFNPKLGGEEQSKLFYSTIETESYEITSSNFGMQKSLNVELLH